MANNQLIKMMLISALISTLILILISKISDRSPVDTDSLATRIIEEKQNNSLLMCRFPVIKNILSWKCPNRSTANSPKPKNSTLQNNPPASTSQPVKK